MSKVGQARLRAINKINNSSHYGAPGPLSSAVEKPSWSPLEIFVILCIIVAFIIIAAVVVSLAVLFVAVCWWVIVGLINGF